MPTFTAITLDRLLEPGAPKSVVNNKPPTNPKLERNTTSTEKKFHWAQRSPALYATPEPTPLPDTPSSFPPSPYIINHKRRGPRLLKSASEEDVSSGQNPSTDEEKLRASMSDPETDTREDVPVTSTLATPVLEEHLNSIDNGDLGHNQLAGNVTAGEIDLQTPVALNSERNEETEDFFDPRESMSFTSNTDGEDGSGVDRSLKLNTPMGEFYDAWEELSNDGTPCPSPCNLEAEVRETRLSLLMEIDKRKQAEETLNTLRLQWQRVSEQLSLVGLTLPSAEATISAGIEQVDYNPAEELCQQVSLARFVSNSVGRGLAKAEVEEEMEAQMESKNFEIARLLDRLHYYEAVNREMSQRNQEVMEMARRQRQKRKRRQRWVWGSIATVITLGSAALVWSYLPSARASSSTDHSQLPEHDVSSK